MNIELWGGGEATFVADIYVATEAPHQYFAKLEYYLSHKHDNIYDAESRFSKIVRNRDFSKI
jgi:hypothetical protein